MTPQDLKNSILQLAIQGKLVEQRPEEGTAEDLYRQIQSEKQALIKAGKIKKEKPLAPITDDEIPFEIPESWMWVRLSDICNVSDGTHQTPHYVENGIPFISAQNIKPYKFLPEIHRFISQKDYEFYNANVSPEKGDILMTRVGAMIGEAAIIDIDMKFSIYVSLTLIKCYKKDYDMTYILYVLNSHHGRELAKNKTLGKSASQGNLNLIFIRNFLLPLPPLAEQHRIVAKIESIMPHVDEFAAAQSKLHSIKEDLRKSLLQYAIQGKLVEQRPEEGTAEDLYRQIQSEKQALIKAGKIKKEKPLAPINDDEIPFEIPENWMWVRWGEISESIQYGYNAPALDHGRIKMVRISDIQDNKVIWERVPYCEIAENDIADYLLKPNDILFARTGGTVGKSYLVKEVPVDAIYAGYLIRTRYSSNLCPQYLKYFMGSDLYWKQLVEGTIATAQPNCNGKTLSKMILPLPPLAEQHRIVAKLEEIFVTLDELA